VTTPPTQPRHHGRPFWLLLPVGGLLMAWGVVGLLRQSASSVPASWLRWLVGGLLAHDLLLAPAVFAVGLAVRRLPPALRPPVRAALIVSGTLGLMTVPLLLGYGRATQPGNVSLLPGNYPVDLALVLAAVWAGAGVWALLTYPRHRRPAPPRSTGCSG
jgi:hypothetical protein